MIIAPNIDLRLGDWRKVLSDVESCDAVITDPPFSAKTHKGHNGQRTHDEHDRKLIGYSAWSDSDVTEFVDAWAPRCKGWFAAMTSHDLFFAYRDALAKHDRYTFAPVPLVIRGATVRMRGDGPSSWTVWLVVSRPRTKEAASWGTLPGAYVVSRERKPLPGSKPLLAMQDILNDYTRPGDLVVDPCAGLGTTLVAAHDLRRNAIGAEVDPETYEKALAYMEEKTA